MAPTLFLNVTANATATLTTFVAEETFVRAPDYSEVPLPTGWYGPGEVEAPTAWGNHVHEAMVPTMNYVLLFPFILVGIGALIINIIHIVMCKDVAVKNAIAKGEELHKKIVLEARRAEAQGKAFREKERQEAKFRASKAALQWFIPKDEIVPRRMTKEQVKENDRMIDAMLKGAANPYIEYNGAASIKAIRLWEDDFEEQGATDIAKDGEEFEKLW